MSLRKIRIHCGCTKNSDSRRQARLSGAKGNFCYRKKFCRWNAGTSAAMIGAPAQTARAPASSHFELTHLVEKRADVLFVLLGNCIHFAHGRADFLHAVYH